MTGPMLNIDFAIFIYFILGGVTLVALIIDHIFERR